MTKVHPTAPSPERKPEAIKHRKRKPGKRHPGEPAKPYKGFPLFTVASGKGKGRWAKKVRGKLWYFGTWDEGPEAALQRWNEQEDDLRAGRVPRSRGGSGGATLRDLCNRFMTTKTRMLSPTACRGILERSQKNKKELPPDLLEVLEQRAGANIDANGLSIRSWTDYNHICSCLIQTFGRDRLMTDFLSEDFERLRADWSKRWGPVRLGNKINLVRIVFRYAYKNRLIPLEIEFGEGFKRPSRKELRVARAEEGLQRFEAAELRRVIEAASQPMKTMIWLAINCGLGNNDVALLPTSALNLETGWLTYPRPKTGIMRKCWLWPETVQAIREWLAKRPEPNKPEDAGLVFITAKGGSWAKETSDNPVSKETRKLLDRLGINGYRNFYTLRHTFETIAGESRDQVVVDAIMGHVDGSMAATYCERISDERLQAVADLVRSWLLAEPEKATQAKSRLKIASEEVAAASA